MKFQHNSTTRQSGRLTMTLVNDNGGDPTKAPTDEGNTITIYIGDPDQFGDPRPAVKDALKAALAAIG
ncbi:hypothetical protein [Chenggangzhangella methanolivorans]|uniref:Uncharacterized protein n=1 Tax=Chenggangzhangella methanolivorans TaxID=1437009 RepID=A0A9E6R7C4_9HYPH|nr:hypothetical protein [Chenggangzhangella methanolivorans]QZN99557.1 hypothetical protein K6K41_23075 [Chenggangzhangella methanolivorans]